MTLVRNWRVLDAGDRQWAPRGVQAGLHCSARRLGTPVAALRLAADGASWDEVTAFRTAEAAVRRLLRGQCFRACITQTCT